jgi:uncharacterized damage-inducible protein DinB
MAVLNWRHIPASPIEVQAGGLGGMAGSQPLAVRATTLQWRRILQGLSLLACPDLSTFKEVGGTMKHLLKIAVCCFLMWSVSAGAQAAKPNEEPRSVSQVLDGSAANMEKEFVSAAEAMPEDKYGFAPSSGEFKGVRTFALQVKHVAAVNYILGASILQEKPPVEVAGESGPDSITTKADIVKYLKASFEYAHKAIGTINEKNFLAPIKWPFGDRPSSRLEVAGVVTSHGFDHYGQIVVYLRSNGIVPPASR